ncbi:MAG TPA: 16S rRNA (guanine(527)-N(7))-methyltransferase RsmG [Candidatus Hydrogenedentes bacterium]|nr:16S rRNA (guanine(527)-N(7))-methyltransferase RsmG [Candidatus Hydrogenedentota bacterium]HOL78113.1 16S rRNA (guanine(527)-N(7))-methyltransferase RsmG [Candidatus Hydrogenedentota bacterium]HPO86482.1 16S rRNA (guanine(527)-N(7))-methyltransferase RsmG [Candidatus Hydrogenedentota bacterium]
MKEEINFQIFTLLEKEGYSVSPSVQEQLQAFLTLVRRWNAVFGLVSQNDLEQLEVNHLADSLSLMGTIRRYVTTDAAIYLDIGSGAGFPAIPLKILCPKLETVLVERSSKRAGFLRKVIAALDLKGISLMVGEFPTVVKGLHPSVITARAVEKPLRLVPGLKPLIQAGSVFLCQCDKLAEQLSGMFHVEHWEDDWTRAGIRRGRLYLVMKS